MTDKLSRPMHAKAVESEWEEFFPEPHRTWMKTYFKLPSNKPTNTLVAIMDEQQGKFTSRLYMNGKCVDHPHESLASALSISKHSSAKTRIVLLVHDGRRGLNRDMIGTIYQTYGLNPLFLRSHFLWDFANRKCVDHPSGTDHPSDEPFTLTHSDEFLQLEYMGAQMSAIVLENVKPSTSIRILPVSLIQ